MDIYVIVLRLAHIVGGVFWAGGVMMLVRFLQPAARSVGRAGGQFMSRLMMERKLGQAMGGSGAITVLSGVLLFWVDFGGFMGDPTVPMIGFGVGGLAGLTAWIIGAITFAPIGRRLAPLMERSEAGEDVEAEIRSVVGSTARYSPALGTLVLAAVVLMAVSRYL